ncbi:hypothetical protein MJH12_09030, partial [bacterium]|nr:hypothetical protein [bacterium]
MRIKQQLLSLAILVFLICIFFAYFNLYLFSEKIQPSLNTFPQLMESYIQQSNVEKQVIKLELLHTKSNFYYQSYLHNSKLKDKQLFYLYDNLLQEELPTLFKNPNLAKILSLQKLKSIFKLQHQNRLQKINKINQDYNQESFNQDNELISILLSLLLEKNSVINNNIHIQGKTFAKNTIEDSETFKTLFFVILFIAFIPIITVIFYISNQIVSQLRQVEDFIQEITRGNYSAQMRASKGEFYQIAQSFNSMATTLDQTTVKKNTLEEEVIKLLSSTVPMIRLQAMESSFRLRIDKLEDKLDALLHD